MPWFFTYFQPYRYIINRIPVYPSIEGELLQGSPAVSISNQHSHVDGIDYFVSGAAGKLRGRAPNRFDQAHTESWSAQCHFLLVRIDDNVMLVRPIGELSAAGALREIERLDPDGQPVVTPLTTKKGSGVFS